MNVSQRVLIFLLSSSLFFTFCKKDESGKPTDEDPKEEVPTVTILVTTDAVRSTTVSTATLVSTINVSGEAEITEAGVCWSISEQPVIGDNKVIGESAVGAYADNSRIFENVISGLDAGKEYYVRAYAVYKDSVIYGNELSFLTSIAEGLSQYWKFGDSLQTGNLVANYDAFNYTVLFADQNVFGNIGTVNFSGEIVSPKEYLLVGADTELDENMVSLSMAVGGKEWKSIADASSKLFVREEQDKIIIEFENVVMRSVTDGKEVKTSGLLLIP